MNKCRIRFEKIGRAKYISHLDLMRTFQHAFIRSGIRIKHTEGFNPHPYISIALPLQLGCESVCEQLDIQLDDDMPPEKIPEKLNPWLPEGLLAVSASEPVCKVGQLRYVRCRIEFIYDDGRADERRAPLESFFAQDSIVISKKTKKGMGQLDIAPHVNDVSVSEQNANTLIFTAVLSAVEPTVNPSNIVDALCQLRSELAPDFARYRRTEVYDEKMQIFR